MHKPFTLFILCLLAVGMSMMSSAQIIRGRVTDGEGRALPGVSVFIKNSSRGVSTDTTGYYALRAGSGQFVLVFRMMGFEQIEREVNIKSGTVLTMDILLREQATALGEVLVVSDTRDFGREIMQKVRENRRNYVDALSSYKCDVYTRLDYYYHTPKRVQDSLEKARNDSIYAQLEPELAAKAKRKLKRLQRKIHRHPERYLSTADSVLAMKDTMMVRYISALGESVSLLYHKDPGRYKEYTAGQNDFLVKQPEYFYYFGIGDDMAGFSVENATSGYFSYNAVPNDPSSVEVNFYKSQINLPQACEKTLQSPLAPSSGVNYIFRYDGVSYRNCRSYYKINVDPVFANDALFKGYIIVEDSSWALRYVDLSINPNALRTAAEYRIIQRFSPVGDMYLPDSVSLITRWKDGRSGNTRIINRTFTNWKLDPVFPPKTFNDEVKKFEPGALERDSNWWDDHRPYPLNSEELEYCHKIDSLSDYYNSDKFLFRMDSTYNRIDIWSVVYKGINYRNRNKRYQININPLVSQINPFGIGGYRHNLSGSFMKRFKNEFLLETEGMIDYGFRNSDVRGRVGVGLTYVPLHFVRTFVRYGDSYSMINSRSSITNIFSRSNYARTQTISISQRMEVVNGLFASLTFTYSDQKPITGMQMDNWSNLLFGEANKPTDFDRYIKSELTLDLIYRIRQKYVIKGKRKIMLGSKWPDITVQWRHGIKGLFNSEVNFDYLEFGVKGYNKLARWGTSNWEFLTGSFVNRKNLRVLEYKYFRGSDPIFFSNPLLSFQLLGPTLECSTSFLRACYIHHFDGSLLDKVPLISYLRLSPAIGGGYLMMQEKSFRHFEVFAGIERVIRIRRELFRLGVYAVTADNNLSKATFTWKIGVSTSSVGMRRWDY